MLWPVGEISSGGYHQLSELLNSAVSGAKSVGSPKILIHLANGWDKNAQASWYKSIQQQGEFTLDDFDIMAVSFCKQKPII